MAIVTLSPTALLLSKLAAGILNLEIEKTMSNIRRSRHLIDNEVQYSLVRRILMHWVFFMVANAIMYLFWVRLFDNPTGSWSETFTLFGRQFLPILIVSLALLPVFLRDAIKLSNRFAGPIMRLRQTLRDVLAGQKVKPLSFRSGDFWQSLSIDFNKAVGIEESASSDK